MVLAAAFTVSCKKKVEPEFAGYELPQVEEGSPEDATLNFLDSIKNLDENAIRQYLSNPDSFRLTGDPERDAVLIALARDYFDRMDIKLGDAEISGGTAVVDMTFRVPDLNGAITAMTADIVRQSAAAAFRGQELDVQEFAFNYMETKLDLDKLNHTETTAPVVLVRNGDEWLVDTNSGANRPLFDALSGGILTQLEGLPFLP
jgi:hypothetical protein